MIERILAHVNNWFTMSREYGVFTVQNGQLTLPTLQTGQYFRIVGSVFNDGVYQYPAVDLQDETFEGSVWGLAIPKELIELADRMTEWEEKNGDPSMYQSESFGGYTYTKATDSETGNALNVFSAFRSELNRWRKI